MAIRFMILAELFLLLVIARLFGVLSLRLGYAPSVGELTAGIALATILAVSAGGEALLAQLRLSPAVELVANTGIFALVLLAGIEMKPSEISEHRGGAFFVALGGMIVPLATGMAVASLFLPEGPMKGAQVFLVGTALSISAIPETVKVLGELGLLHHRIGKTVVAAAFFDDIFGLFLLAVLMALIRADTVPELTDLAVLLGKVVLYFAVIVAIKGRVFEILSRRKGSAASMPQQFSVLMAVAMAYAIAAEFMGMHWIIGAFVAGLFFEPEKVGRKVYRNLKSALDIVTSGFLGPLFFVTIGLLVDPDLVGGAPARLLALIAVAFLGKFLGAGVPAYFAGLGVRGAMAVGAGMSARGAIELVFLNVAREAGVFDTSGAPDDPVGHLFSALVVTAVVTTLATPILLKRILRDDDERPQ